MGTPQKAASETLPSGAFQGKRYSTSAPTWESSGRAWMSRRTLWVRLKVSASALSSATSGSTR
eukprot:4801807-Alexandrium_andersonii.AAC.1